MPGNTSAGIHGRFMMRLSMPGQQRPVLILLVVFFLTSLLSVCVTNSTIGRRRDAADTDNHRQFRSQLTLQLKSLKNLKEVDTKGSLDLQGMNLNAAYWQCSEADAMVLTYTRKALTTLAKYMNFTFTVHIYCVNDLGDFMGDFRAGKIDLICEVRITDTRRKMIDFITPIREDYFAIIIKMPPRHILSTFTVLSPLDAKTWTLLFIYAGLGILFLTVCTTLTSFRNTGEFLKNLIKVTVYILGTCAAQGGTYNANTTASRVFATMWWFFIVVILGIYTGALVSFLSIETTVSYPFTSLQEAVESDHIPTVVRGFAGEAILKDSNPDSELGKLWKKALAHPEAIVTSEEVALNLVLTANYGFIVPYSYVRHILALENSKYNKCKLTLAPFTFTVSVDSWAMYKNHSSYTALNKGMQSLTESGIFNKWQDDTVSEENCWSAKESTISAQNIILQNVVALFYTLLGGSAVALTVLCAELILGTYNTLRTLRTHYGHNDRIV